MQENDEPLRSGCGMQAMLALSSPSADRCWATRPGCCDAIEARLRPTRTPPSAVRRLKAVAGAGRAGVWAALQKAQDPAERPGTVLAAGVAAAAADLIAEEESPAHQWLLRIWKQGLAGAGRCPRSIRNARTRISGCQPGMGKRHDWRLLLTGSLLPRRADLD